MGIFFTFSVKWRGCFFQAEDGIRGAQESRGLGDVYKRQDAGGRMKEATSHKPQAASNKDQDRIPLSSPFSKGRLCRNVIAKERGD